MRTRVQRAHTGVRTGCGSPLLVATYAAKIKASRDMHGKNGTTFRRSKRAKRLWSTPGPGRSLSYRGGGRSIKRLGKTRSTRSWGRNATRRTRLHQKHAHHKGTTTAHGDRKTQQQDRSSAHRRFFFRICQKRLCSDIVHWGKRIFFL